MANAVVLWVIMYFCVTSVNTKDTIDERTMSRDCHLGENKQKMEVSPKTFI